MANAVGPKPIVLQRAFKRFLVKCPTTYEEAIEKARRVFRYAQDDVLSLSCVAEDGEKAQIYSDDWECLVSTVLVVYVDKEEDDQGDGTVVPRPMQSPKTECEPSVAEPEPTSSEAEEEAGILEEIASTTTDDEETEQPPRSRSPSPTPTLTQDPEEQIIVVIQFCAPDSITYQQQYKLRRRTKISKAFHRFEMDIGYDRNEIVYLFNDKAIDQNQCAQEIGIHHGGTICAVQVT